MNKRSFLALLLGAGIAALGAPAAAQAVDVEGVKFEPSIQLGGATLPLNGAGLRKRAIFKVYAAGLYVPQKSNSAAALLAQKGPRRVQIGMLRDVDADTFAASLNEGLRNNLTDAQYAAIKAQAESLTATLKAAGEAKKGDAIFFEFLPDSGTRVVINGKPVGNPIAGEDFFTAVLRIWLGDKPADADLKKALLGG
jgi:hypothetical protein